MRHPLQSDLRSTSTHAALPHHASPSSSALCRPARPPIAPAQTRAGTRLIGRLLGCTWVRRFVRSSAGGQSQAGSPAGRHICHWLDIL